MQQLFQIMIIGTKRRQIINNNENDGRHVSSIAFTGTIWLENKPPHE